MPSGTVVNNIFCSNLHKSNAHVKLREAQEDMEHIEKALIFLIAANGNQDDCLASISTLSDMLSGFSDANWQVRMAGSIIDHPEDCVDELN